MDEAKHQINELEHNEAKNNPEEQEQKIIQKKTLKEFIITKPLLYEM